MMDLLKRDLAPITDVAWEEIDRQATRVLRSLLTARKFADILGPYGPQFGAVPAGRLDIVKGSGKAIPDYGVHKVHPLLEVRIPFDLDIWELDNAARGADDIDLSNLEEAATKIAAFEEGILYAGSREADIPGIAEASSQPSVAYDQNPASFLKAVAEGVTQLRASAVEGPYALVVDKPMWSYLSSSVQGRPLRHHLEYILQGPVLLSTFTESCYLVSMRGGDLELVIGQDIAIGYSSHDKDRVRLYFTESFTYRILDSSTTLFFQGKA
ncbi:MAG: family 1 encapsulin nanocompartment shell protein [Alkalispirochaetaceae bacterium]